MSAEQNTEATRSESDCRVYVTQPDSWTGHVKSDSSSENCHFQKEGDDFFHRLAVGELYIQRGTEKCCLACALKHRFLTDDRMHWKKGD